MYRKLEKNASKYISLIFLLIVKTTKIFFLMPVGTCKFVPSCSEYANDAINKYSLGKALIKIVIRVLRCNPFSKGGFDPA